MSISGSQCRAARALLGWTRQTLSQRTELGMSAIQSFENDPASATRNATKALIRTTLESAGIIFVEPDESGGEGVRRTGD